MYQSQKRYQNISAVLTDKDCQQFSKAYRLACQRFYENLQSKSAIEDLVNLTQIIPQIVSTKSQSNAISVVSQLQILKAKAKNQQLLRQKIDKAIEHLQRPKKMKLNTNILIQILKKSQIFSIGCLISIRLFNELQQDKQAHIKQLFEALGTNLLVNPNIVIQLLQLLCNTCLSCRSYAVREGIVKSIFLNYLPQAIKQKLTLYRCLKLLSTISKSELSILKQRQKILSLAIYTYQQYIPIISDICSKCYQYQYCNQIQQRLFYQNIDQFYLWSYSQSFCKELLSENFIQSLYNILKGKNISSYDIEIKIFAIIGNYCKYCQYNKKQLLKILPKYNQSLLNFLKMCLSLVRVDPQTIQLINWPMLDQLIVSTSNSKVIQLHKMLKQMIDRKVMVGTISNSLKSIFSWQKHADLLSERICRIPKNNTDLQDIRQVLNEGIKSGASQFDRDTLQMMKQKALQSLHQSISQSNQLDLGPIINQWQLNSVQLLSKFFQIIQLNLMMNQGAIDKLNIDKILQMIRWLQQNYNGEIVDWGGIVQILGILFDQQQWIKHIRLLPKDCFWILQIGRLDDKTQKILFNAIDQAYKSKDIKKLAMIIGFTGKILQNKQKLKLLKIQDKLFKLIKQQLNKKNNYKINLMMLSYFLKGWYLQQDQDNYKDNNYDFKIFIAPLVDIVITNYRALPQQHYFLENCLPYKIQTHSLTKNTGQLINTNGKLAAYLYENEPKIKNSSLTSQKFASFSNLPAKNLIQNLRFLSENPQFINNNELTKLLQRITKNKDSYWNLYPHYSGILSTLIELLNGQNKILKNNLTDNIISIINEIEDNKDIGQDEHQDLLNDMCDSLQRMKKKGTYIQIERIKKIITKITKQQIRQQIIYILNQYKIKQQAPKPIPIQPIKIQNKNIPVNIIEPNINKMDKNQLKQQLIQQKIKQNQLQQQGNLINFHQISQISKQIQIPKSFNNQSLQQLYQSVKYQSIKNNNVFSILQILKRIVEKIQPISKFNQIYSSLLSSKPSQTQKDLMGSLLAKYYQISNDQRALTLLLDKERTNLAKEQFQQLVTKHIHAFKLTRRWRFQSRQAIDISMQRIKQDYLDDACIVATYNLKKIAQLEYFHSKKYGAIIYQTLSKVISEDQVAHFLTLIGTVSKLPQIKQKFLALMIHVKIMPLNTMFPLSVKVNSSLCYALSTLSFEQPKACSQIVQQKDPLVIIYDCLKNQPINKMIVEPGVCLIANLSYGNAQIKQTLRQKKTVSLLLLLFQRNLVNTDMNIYKQLLRCMGNLSMNKQCTQQLLEYHFCNLAIKMAENLDFFVFYDQKKARLMKLLINLIFNLANHKIKLEKMHEQKISLLIITLLQTTQKNIDLLGSCIDTVDALCQSPFIQQYMIQKKLIYILMDVLKLTQQATIILKAARLVSNLTIQNACIPLILKTSILSVIGNVVVPNLYVGCMPEQTSKKIQAYILKILLRIYQVKPQLQLVLKSGYLDCLVRTIQLIEVQDNHIEIFFFYSSHLPNFLNKRAFSCLIKVLLQKIDNKNMIARCIVSFKHLLNFSYHKDDEDEVIENIPDMYQKIMNSEFLVDGLYLLVHHLLRSHSLRQILRKKDHKLFKILEDLGEDETYAQMIKIIIFLIYNPFTPIYHPIICQHQQQQQFYDILRKGFRIRLYRGDGSSKQAKLDIDEGYNIRLYKYPDGEIKQKYILNINHLRDLQIQYTDKQQLWKHTIFNIQCKNGNKKLFMTLIGSSRWGQIKLINFEFNSEEQKLLFYQCISHLIYLFKS